MIDGGMRPDKLQAFGVIAGMCLILTGFTNLLASNPGGLFLAGLGFFAIGVAISGAHMIAALRWRAVTAAITEVIPDDPPVFRLQFEVEGRTVKVETSETSSRQVGDTFPIRVDPANPTTFISMGWTPLLLGVAFVGLGAVFTLGGIANSLAG